MNPPRKETPNHISSYGLVFANDIARADFAAKPLQPFRPGAIIVREKLAEVNGQTPELLAVMIKREKGFNRAANDWEFVILNGAATKVKHREKSGDCLTCHVSQKANDFVYRDYE